MDEPGRIAGCRRADSGAVVSIPGRCGEKDGLYICTGSYLRSADGKLQNSSAFIDPKGNLLGTFRRSTPKTHPEEGIYACWCLAKNTRYLTRNSAKSALCRYGCRNSRSLQHFGCKRRRTYFLVRQLERPPVQSNRHLAGGVPC